MHFFRMRGSQSPEFMIHASTIVQVETTSVTRTWSWYLEVWLKCVNTPKSIGLSGFIIMFPIIWLSFGVKKKKLIFGPQPKYDAKNGSAPCRSPPDPQTQLCSSCSGRKLGEYKEPSQISTGASEWGHLWWPTNPHTLSYVMLEWIYKSMRV